MKKTSIELWKKDEYTYPAVGGFIPNLVTYLHEEETVRPALLVIPGGGYTMVAAGEAEPVAKKFYEMGYQVFVLCYTTTCVVGTPVGLWPLKDAGRAMVHIRKHAAEFQVNPDQIAVCGFSAGGHLAGSLGVHYDIPELTEQAEEYQGISSRPDALILCYPVITTEEGAAHMDSFHALEGEVIQKERLEFWSLEKHVKRQTPPAFLWHTAADELVPVENSFRMEQAYRRQGVPCELHIFPRGNHGYSVADEAWAAGEYGDDYAMNQFVLMMQYFIDHETELPAPFSGLKLPKGTDYREIFRNSPKEYLQAKANPHVAIWPQLADGWLRELFEKKGGEEA